MSQTAHDKLTSKRPRRWARGLPIGAVAAALTGAGLLTGCGMRIMNMPGRSYSGPLPPLTAEETEIRDGLRQHVHRLATEIGERNFARGQAMGLAQGYLTETLKNVGYQVRWQAVALVNGYPNVNLQAEIRGTSHPEQILIIGAHYDTVPGCPGANDNSSGVAAMLEIARLCAARPFGKTVRFVAFFNEESLPGGPVGSYVYASSCRRQQDNIVGMICLETMGFYTDAPNSQRYPLPFSLFYPSTGNFVAFVGNLDSRDFVHQVIGAFRAHTSFPSEGVAAPAFLRDAGRSDHRAFWVQGYPGLMVTDTANFRYAYYHQPGDTEDKLDYDRTARVTLGLTKVVEDLAK